MDTKLYATLHIHQYLEFLIFSHSGSILYPVSVVAELTYRFIV